MRVLAVLLLVLAFPGTAFAYIGPGAGLSLLGALWALVAAVALAVAFVIAWPVRQMLRRRRADPSQVHGQPAPQPDGAGPGSQQTSRSS